MIGTAVITGGAQGIGRALVEHLLAEGWQVAALDRDDVALAELIEAQQSAKLLALECDVADETQVSNSFRQVHKWQAHEGGSDGLDLLVNNAGLTGAVSGPIEDLSLEHWRRWLDSHLTGAFLCTRAAVPALRRQRGSIVNISSTRALQSEPNSEPYAAAKGALLALTHALAISLGPEVRVNVVCPGWIETGPWKKSVDRHEPSHSAADRDQHPVGRVGTPEDVVAAVAFLASPSAGFITGQHLVVDGGMTRKMIYLE